MDDEYADTPLSSSQNASVCDQLNMWLDSCICRHTLHLMHEGAVFDQAIARDIVAEELSRLPPEPSVYLLLINSAQGRMPIYIGKATNPARRWRDHLAGFVSGKGAYHRWRSVLLSNGCARYAVDLVVVPASAIVQPPVPGFPYTIGAVEYQLVDLADSAWPGRLLNHEGARR